MKRFFLYRLRTTDVPAARTFYTRVLGGSDVEIFQLHEQALARGARPHWLGHVDIGEVEVATSAFAARGATPLGPKWVDPQGLEAAMVRDPGGALIALSKPGPAQSQHHESVSRPDVVWHVLNTVDVESAKANYGELLGWAFQEPVDFGDLGVFHPFAWQPGGAAIGAMFDIANRPSIHPHWLFHFRVAKIEDSLKAVRDGGGTSLDPITLPNGDRIAVCDDPQGAAFALFEAN